MAIRWWRARDVHLKGFIEYRQTHDTLLLHAVAPPGLFLHVIVEEGGRIAYYYGGP